MRYICRTILAPTVIGSAVYYLASRFGLAYKPFLVLCSVVVGWPIGVSLGAGYDIWRREHRARAFGAVTASQSRWKPFSDIHLLRDLLGANKNGFIGELTCLGYEPCIVLSNTPASAR